MQKRHALLAGPVMAVLLLAGFGCRPILDATKSREQEVREISKQELWFLEEPAMLIVTKPDATGEATLDLKTQEGSTVTVTLTGPGVVGEKTQTKEVEPDGYVKFAWQVNRYGRYSYDGSVIFNRIVVATFVGDADAY